MTNAPCIFVVHSDPLVRSLLKSLARSVSLPTEFFESGQHFLDFLAETTTERAGCLIADIRLPGISGLELQHAPLVRQSALPVVFFTKHGEVATATQALKAGAFDFVEQQGPQQRILDAMQAALRHDQKQREMRDRHKILEARLAQLTPGERDVLALMADGKSYKLIAKELNLSYKTVEARRGKIMKKMHAETLPELMRMAIAVLPPVSAAGV